MTLRDYLHKLEASGELLRVAKPISKTYEIAAVLKQLEPRPVLFENVRESEFPVAGNLFSSKADFADYFGREVSELITMLTQAISGRSPGRVVANAVPLFPVSAPKCPKHSRFRSARDASCRVIRSYPHVPSLCSATSLNRSCLALAIHSGRRSALVVRIIASLA